MAVSLNPSVFHSPENIQSVQPPEIVEEQSEAEREAERARGLESLNRIGLLLQQSGNRQRIQHAFDMMQAGGGHQVVQLNNGATSPENSDSESDNEISESDSDDERSEAPHAASPRAAPELADRGEPGRQVDMFTPFAHGALNGILGGIVGCITSIFLKNVSMVGGFLVGGVLVAVTVLSRLGLESIGGGVSRCQSVACSILVGLSVALLIPVFAEFTITYGATLTIGTSALVVRELVTAILTHTI